LPSEGKVHATAKGNATITPPVRLNCFIVARYANRPVAEVFHGTFPHFIAHLIAIAILVAFPSIILWLPSQMGN
jgi:TRAP-type C4-dicarboxylate transport system permease large subunit